MSSDRIAEIASLIDKTESNMKRIESVSGDFVFTVLNEWRYATRHIVKVALAQDSEEEYRKAVSHLKRAYFDSCDILVDCLLDRIAEHSRTYSGYSEIMVRYIPDFGEYVSVIKEARDKHLSAQSFTDNQREQHYDALVTVLERLDQFVKLLEDTKESWIQDVRKQKRRDQIPVLIGITPIALACLGYIWKLIRQVFCG